MPSFRRILLATSALLLLAGCATAPAPTAAPPGCAPAPVRSTVEHARNFTLRYEPDYQVLTVNQPSPGAAPESYVLLRCGANPLLPPELATAQKIPVPIRSLYSGSTTHLPLLTDLGRVDVLTGVAAASFVSSPQVRAKIAAGSVAEYAPNGPVDLEKVVAARPDVVMTAGTDDPAYGPLRAAGIAVVANAEYLEPTPLGRAEWIKVMAALTGDESRASAVFDQVEAAYTATARKAAAVPRTPVVAGQLYEGTWSVPAGGSYLGALICDAGGSQPWESDRGTGSLSLDLETVLARAGRAPIWLATNDWNGKADALAADPRYGELAAMRTGQAWTANRAIGPDGGNDLYERGVTRPDLVLGDLVAILHPDLAPGHAFTFYDRLQ